MPNFTFYAYGGNTGLHGTFSDGTEIKTVSNVSSSMSFSQALNGDLPQKAGYRIKCWSNFLGDPIKEDEVNVETETSFGNYWTFTNNALYAGAVFEKDDGGGGINTLKTGDILNYDYTGSVQTITLPKGQYKLECWGAQGGYRSSSTYGGKGGYSVGTITLNEKTDIYIYAGGAGNTPSTATNNIYPGGFNGGGYRYKYKGGGGASDIRVGKDSLYSRVIVAGGGGSDGATNKKGMYGGGTSGGSSTESYTYYSSYCGKGGTQTYSGYSTNYTITTQPTTGLNTSSTNYYCGGFGFGGGGVYLNSGYGGAGGGGWYGGSGTVPDGSGDDDRGGGGGSGYVYTSSTASNYPSGCLLNSSYYLTDASTTSGSSSFTSPSGSSETGHTGSGYVRITVINVESAPDFRLKTSNGFVKASKVLIKVNEKWNEATKRLVKVNGVWKE